MSILKKTSDLGTAIWLDYIKRSFIEDGEMAKFLEAGARGVTSNPAIFKAAIADSKDYDEAMADLVAEGKSAYEIYEALAMGDIQKAADIFLPLYEETKGADGFVSLEVNPRWAHDEEETVAEARRFFAEVARPNLMVKVPATPEGIKATRALIALGINVNVTLIFSVEAYCDTARAYVEGLKELKVRGGDLSRVASVASFFVSRLDSAVDPLLGAMGRDDLTGKAAIDNAKIAYTKFLEIFSGPEWDALAKAGAMVQRPLWASTGTKSAKLPDTLYVDALIGPNTVNTVPPATLNAYLDHGTASRTLDDDLGGAAKRMEELARLGIDLGGITDALLADGLKSFAQAFDSLLRSVEDKITKFLTSRVLMEESLGGARAAADAAIDRLVDENVVERLWKHDHTLWAQSPVEISNRLGWLKVHDSMGEYIPRMDALREALLKDGIVNLVLIGMGGSSLAPEVLAKTFRDAKGLKLSVIDTTVPDAIAAVEKANPPKSTAYIVSTKSGGTVETLSLFLYFFNRAVSALGAGEAGRRFIAITDPGSTLEKNAGELGFRECFLNDPNIGGRYAALSLVGLVPGALIGADVAGIIKSASLSSANASAENSPKDGDNIPARLGAIMGAMVKLGKDKLTLVISKEIESLGDWIEQLVAESTGKDGKGILPVVGEALDAPQTYGNDRFFVAITLAGDASLDGGLKKLEEAGHPVVRLSLGAKADLGEQFFTWEAATAVASWFIGVHPFNQPDVESAKVEARAMVANYHKTGELHLDKPVLTDGGIEVYGDVSGQGAKGALEGFLSGLKEGDYVGLMAYVAHGAEVDATLRALAARIKAKYKVPVTVGFGPRFLHSTGQLHKGDAGRGRFVQFTAENSLDLPIPDAPKSDASALSFGVLRLSQALGDAGALKKNGRKVARFHLKSVGELQKLV